MHTEAVLFCYGVEEEQQIRLPVTQEIARAALVNPANLIVF
jgi:hypothetical protein